MWLNSQSKYLACTRPWVWSGKPTPSCPQHGQSPALPGRTGLHQNTHNLKSSVTSNRNQLRKQMLLQTLKPKNVSQVCFRIPKSTNAPINAAFSWGFRVQSAKNTPLNFRTPWKNIVEIILSVLLKSILQSAPSTCNTTQYFTLVYKIFNFMIFKYVEICSLWDTLWGLRKLCHAILLSKITVRMKKLMSESHA